jgi:hypothetical protein
MTKTEQIRLSSWRFKVLQRMPHDAGPCMTDSRKTPARNWFDFDAEPKPGNLVTVLCAQTSASGALRAAQ